MEKNKNSKNIVSRMSELAQDLLIEALRIIVKSLLWVAKNVWKRYFNIETPVYKLWWNTHVKCMQKKLDRAHNQSIYPTF